MEDNKEQRIGGKMFYFGTVFAFVYSLLGTAAVGLISWVDNLETAETVLWIFVVQLILFWFSIYLIGRKLEKPKKQDFCCCKHRK